MVFPHYRGCGFVPFLQSTVCGSGVCIFCEFVGVGVLSLVFFFFSVLFVDVLSYIGVDFFTFLAALTVLGLVVMPHDKRSITGVAVQISPIEPSQVVYSSPPGSIS